MPVPRSDLARTTIGVLAIVALILAILWAPRPMPIRLGADLPLLTMFGGAVGGMPAFGLVGLFIGPVELAVGFTLMKARVGGETRNDGARR